MGKRISSQEGLWFGVMLLGQVTGILAVTAVAGYVADIVFNTRPVGLAVGVVAGSVWGTVTVLTKVVKELR